MGMFVVMYRPHPLRGEAGSASSHRLHHALEVRTPAALADGSRAGHLSVASLRSVSATRCAALLFDSAFEDSRLENLQPHLVLPPPPLLHALQERRPHPAQPPLLLCHRDIHLLRDVRHRAEGKLSLFFHTGGTSLLNMQFQLRAMGLPFWPSYPV